MGLTEKVKNPLLHSMSAAGDFLKKNKEKKMEIQTERVRHVIVGSGAAGFQTAIRLFEGGERDVVLITENRKAGTSRNTGSDKQTYYKISLAGDQVDSVGKMARDLFDGGCVDGDTALCEAALSARGFYSLVELGVPFPESFFGENAGYKTDHDSGRRGTSAGPYTSRLMTERLEEKADRLGITIYDHLQIIRLLVKNKKLYGFLCLDTVRDEYRFIWCENGILATGGPGRLYFDSVYPESQFGANGLALEAGVKGKNLTEWQYGIASRYPRWNVSGTYMQALPVFISAEEDGTGEREFLLPYFSTREEMMSAIFLKGYQWPFDTNRIWNGSSVIDLLVYQETVLLGRRVYLDFRRNTGNKEICFQKLSKEAYSYLKQAGADRGTPFERLKIMNPQAAEFYKEHGTDLKEQPLEIAVCAQHNNGGLSVDCWWETNVKNLFAVGEASGTHGVHRPGGTALNAGQAGALRASQRILQRCRQVYGESGEWKRELKTEEELTKEAEVFLERMDYLKGERELESAWICTQKKMSASGGMIRSRENLQKRYKEIGEELKYFPEGLKITSRSQRSLLFHYRELLLTQKAYIYAMLDYIEHGGRSRGSALYTDHEGKKPLEQLPELFRCRLDQREHSGEVQEITMDHEECSAEWRPVRELPRTDLFFENVWREFRQRNNLE